MNEHNFFPKTNEYIESGEDENELKEVANQFGLFVKIPNPGTTAYNNLHSSCIYYAEAVDRQCKAVRDEVIANSERNRRSYHNKLCVMLLGKTWHETSKEDRDRISNLAVTIGGKEEYVDTF